MQIPRSIVNRAKHLFRCNKVQLTDQFGLVNQVCVSGKTLPEFIFLGSTNVGKSSLLNSLLVPSTTRHRVTNKTSDVPRVSKKAGFTETINLYTVGKLMRLCDSPGYGFKSRGNQGDVVTKFLDTRADAIRNAYILIHAMRGLSPLDISVCQMLSRYGVPFKCVITKADLGIQQDVKRKIDNLYRQLEVPEEDQLFITSSKTGFGIDCLRADLLTSSGLLEFSK